MPAFLARYPQVNADQLFQESGLDPAKLCDRDAMLNGRAFLHLLENAARQTGDPCFALEFAAQRPQTDLSLPEHLLRLAPTLGAGLEDAGRFFGVQNTLGRARFKRGPVESSITYALGNPDGGPSGQHCEFVLFCVVRCFREITGNPEWAPRAVHFTHPALTGPARHERFFGAPVRFGQAENTLFFPTAELAVAPRSADPALLPHLRSHAEERLARMSMSSDVVVKVQQILRESMSSGKVAIEEVAERMDTTPRSLQRRLRGTGRSFQELLMETRLSLSKQYLDDPTLSLGETASLLGYSDPTAFGRAFRRWTGKSPRQFRRKKANPIG